MIESSVRLDDVSSLLVSPDRIVGGVTGVLDDWAVSSADTEEGGVKGSSWQIFWLCKKNGKIRIPISLNVFGYQNILTNKTILTVLYHG